MTPTTSLPLPTTPIGTRRHDLRRSTAAGRFRCSAASSSWWWSAELHALLGMPSDGAPPGLELLLSAVHGDDRAAVAAQLRRTFVTGQATALQHRLVRTDGEVRTVVLFGELEHDPDGGVSALAGLVLDVTPERPVNRGDQVAQLTVEVAQLRTAMASRATIEQAKGAVMVLTGCSPQISFDLLTHFSSTTHRKVRDVAAAIIDSAAGRAPLPDDLQEVLRSACPPPHR